MADYKGIGDELHIEGIPGEDVADWARRAVKECRKYGGAARATFNDVTVHFGTKWEPESLVRQWDRQRRERLAKDGVLASSSPDRPPLKGRFPDKSPLPTDNNDPRADYITWQKPSEAPHLNVLAEAARITSGDRQQAYGHPLDNHSATAEFWTTWLRRRYGADMPALDYRDVCQMMIHQKSSRHANNPKRDNLVDQAGYAHNEDQADIEKAAREANG
jgi:hypothetical protein